MANTFTALHYHVVFSTKHRHPWLRPDAEEDVWRYLGGICRSHGIKALQIGGLEDHVHLLLGVPPTHALSDVVKRIKGESSKWLSNEKAGFTDFAWQDGYGAFTISQSHIPRTIRYIQNQRQHHAKATFEVEYRLFLHIHEIEADERYIFG
jgi:REP element-mobilizing transposase RayT